MTDVPVALRARDLGAEPAGSAARVAGPRRRRKPGRIVRVVIAVIVGLLFLVPFYWVVVTSLNPAPAMFNSPPRFVPSFYFSNYVRAWAGAAWGRYLLNTVLVACCTVALTLITSLLAGFAFGVMRFRGRGALFALVLSVLMIPQVVLLIPDFQIASAIHWVDTYWIQIVPWGASVFGIFLVRQFLLNLPTELFEAAELDGAGRVRILWSIGAPMVRPALIIIALNTFMASWNSFLWPSVMDPTNDSVRPVEVGLYNFLYGGAGTDYTALCAAVTFTTLPVLIIFLVLQRYFITGAFSAAGGVRG